VLNQTPPEKLEKELEKILDIDGVLWFLALDVALINSDGYWTRASDYSLFLDEKGMCRTSRHERSVQATHGTAGNAKAR
jgi:spore coat protein CotH